MSARATWRALACAAALLVAALAPLAVARAEIIHAPERIANPLAARQSWVADEARVLTPAGVAAIDARVFALEKACGAQIAVVTVDSLGEEYTPRQFATALFAQWHVGRAGHDDGALVLLTMTPRRIEVETGYGAEGPLPDGKLGRMLDRYAVPNLRAGDYDTALGTLVDAMAGELERDARNPLPGPVKRVPLAVRIVAAVLAAIGALVGWLRWRATYRVCRKCGKRMTFLPDDREAAFLSIDEVLEEELKSVDHRVFRCEPCGVTLVEHHRRLFSRYSDCPKCGRRTLGYKSHVLVAATTYHEGELEVTRRCARAGCGHVAVTREVIPRVTESSSSSSGGSSSGGGSSSSFGGGSSGGGGAGRSW